MKEKVQKIIETIDGWKTIIGAVGTPIAYVVTLCTPEYTLAHSIAEGFTILFGGTGIAGVIHKYQKGSLPKVKEGVKVE